MGKLKFWDDNSGEWVEIDAPAHTHNVGDLQTSEPEGKIFVSDGDGGVKAISNSNVWELIDDPGESDDGMIYPTDSVEGVSLNDLQLYYREPGDLNHSMGWGYSRHNVDGPVLNGFEGGGFAVGDANEAEDVLVGGWDETGIYLTDRGYVVTEQDIIDVDILGGDKDSVATFVDGKQVFIKPKLGFDSNLPELNITVDNDPIAAPGTGLWDEYRIVEPGNPIYDPVTDQWILVYAGRDELADARLGAVLSSDGYDWVAADNPLDATNLGEDPYLVKDVETGFLWRDSSGRALMFAEEKIGTTQRGILLWRSSPSTLDDWVLFGRILDKGDPGSWCSADVDSPVVVWDGSKLVMLFEGRESASGGGSIGLGFSFDEGETWTVLPDPIIEPFSPYTAMVCDDLVKVANGWVLICHVGMPSGGSEEFFHTERFSTLTEDPSSWDETSFVRMWDQELWGGTDCLMLFGSDSSRGIMLSGDKIFGVTVESTSLEQTVSNLYSQIDGVNSTASNALSTAYTVKQQFEHMVQDPADWWNRQDDDSRVNNAQLFVDRIYVSKLPAVGIDASNLDPSQIALGGGSQLDPSSLIELEFDGLDDNETSSAVFVLSGDARSLHGFKLVDADFSGLSDAGLSLGVVIIDLVSFQPVTSTIFHGYGKPFETFLLDDPVAVLDPQIGVAGFAAVVHVVKTDAGSGSATVSFNIAGLYEKYVAPSGVVSVVECGDDLTTARPDGAVICYWIFDDPSVDVGTNGENIVNSGPADLFYVPEN